MAVSIQPEAVPEAGFMAQLVLWNSLKKLDQETVGFIAMLKHLSQRQSAILFGPLGIEGIDAAIGDGIARGFASRKDERKVGQRLLFPPGHMSDNISN